MPLRRESASEICFAHTPLWGLLLLAAGGGLLVALIRAAPEPPWWTFALAGFFVLAGVHTALWRFELRLDLVFGRYRVRRGIWPRLSVREGSLDELRTVLFSKDWERDSSEESGTSEHLMWRVCLDFGETLERICILASRREDEAYRRAEGLARRLGRPMVDATGATAQVRSPAELDRPFSRPQREPSTRPSATDAPRRAQGAVYTAQGPGGRIIVLPPASFHPVVLLLSLFGLAFAGFALCALGAALGVLPIKVSGNRIVLVVLGTLFTAVGLAIAAVPILGMRARERIEEEGDSLVFSTLVNRPAAWRETGLEEQNRGDRTACQHARPQGCRGRSGSPLRRRGHHARTRPRPGQPRMVAGSPR